MDGKHKYIIGLTGNPNVGKSTFFNTLTGAKQHIGNWPGKTIEKKVGKVRSQGYRVQIVDLPGAYSLTAYSEEESVTSDFIQNEQPNAVIQVIDSQNLIRNLYLTTQLIELGAPLVIALNMVNKPQMNIMAARAKTLSRLLHIPVIIVDARNSSSVANFLRIVLQKLEHIQRRATTITYGTEVNKELQSIQKHILSNTKMRKQELFWLSMRLLEGDQKTEQKLIQNSYYCDIKQTISRARTRLQKIYAQDIHTILVNARYDFLKGLEQELLMHHADNSTPTITEKIDRIAMHRFVGIPLFLLIMWLMFQVTFTASQPVIGWIELTLQSLGVFMTALLGQIGASPWFISLTVDGILAGVGGVLVFTPIIGMLFLCIVLLEDSGYMARVAYIMDKLMHAIGLHGKACIPLILGFGCNVPGILATRMLETPKERLLTILLQPFISCSARLPVYVLFTAAFFSASQGLVILSLYMMGIILAIIVGLLLKKFFIRELSSPFVIELPPYRIPSFYSVVIHVWEKVWQFISKAGTLILAFSIVIWALARFPPGVTYGSSESIAGIIGQKISLVFAPLGFGNWQSAVALIFGFFAKEVIVGTFGTLYGVTDTVSANYSLISALRQHFSPLSAYSFMVFVLLYVPCIAVLAVVKTETHSWKWPLFMIIYTLSIAWFVSFIVYQGGKLLGFA